MMTSDFQAAIARGIFANARTVPGTPAVKEGTGPDIFALVRSDLAVRARVGMVEYGVPLRAANGRDALWDAYEEALDLAVYLRQAVAERGMLASARGETTEPS